MKKIVSVLVLALFVMNYSYSQSTETLTNSTIIKMVKAKLSDDLIIDEINNSRVNFNVTPDSVKFLLKENVSLVVIQAMKTVSPSPLPAVAQVKDTVIQQLPKEPSPAVKEISAPIAVAQPADTLNMSEKKQMKPETASTKPIPGEKTKVEKNSSDPVEKSTISVDAVSYVIPLEELMTFFDKEFNSLSVTIKTWDEKIRNSLEKGNELENKIRQLEKELADKKNIDSKGYTTDIIKLKSRLSEYRTNHKQYEDNMVTEGLKISKEIEETGNETDQSINKKFSEISQNIKKTDPDPALNITPKSVSITKQKINSNVTNYILPVTDLLFCYQNEIISIRDVIVLWNAKVMTINKKDSELIEKSEPLKKDLTNLQINPKVNKEQISALKKQISNIDKERKLLSRQMEADSKELSASVTQMCKEIQSSVKERLSDIIENIKYSYQDNFTYRNI
jgi:predicted  nucleic acid-binding Zn-ribbon protein